MERERERERERETERQRDRDDKLMICFNFIILHWKW